MSNMNPFRVGFIAFAVAAAMLAIDTLWSPVFTLRISRSFEMPLWILCAVFGALQFILWYATRRRLFLSDDEVAKWGSQLEAVTPTILDQARSATPVKEIAEAVQKSHDIPVDVTLRYIIALGQSDAAE
jgi:hypothetical protein